MKLLSLLSLFASIIQLSFGATGSVWEGGTVHIDCGDWPITIGSAVYRKVEDVNIHSNNKAHYSLLASACNFKHQCSFTASNDVLGDPYPGHQKVFDYVYTCNALYACAYDDDDCGLFHIDCGSFDIQITMARNWCKNPYSTLDISDKTLFLQADCDGKQSCLCMVPIVEEALSCTKHLNYAYTCSGGSYTVWGPSIIIDCGSEAITIESAHFICSKDGRRADKTLELSALCGGKKLCYTKVSVDALGFFGGGDPFWGCDKSFEYNYICGVSSAKQSEPLFILSNEIKREIDIGMWRIWIYSAVFVVFVTSVVCCVYIKMSQYFAKKKGEGLIYEKVTEMDDLDGLDDLNEDANDVEVMEDLINDK